MMTFILAEVIAFCVAVFGIGLVTGIYLDYYLTYMPLRKDYKQLVSLLARMKRQGFVPQFTFEQATKPDVSKDIVEF